MGIKPATPGTLVVLAATVLLVLVSVSTPILKSIYFLKASIDTTVSSTTISGDVTLGAWGYCVDSTCTSATLGYSLDVASLFDVSSSISGVSTAVLKWITYLMILHPIAAVFGIISTLFGMLAHMSSWGHTKLTTCFASFAASFSLLAFIFDIVVFYIAKKRIESSDVGGTAELGNAVWMTLAAFIMYSLAGCFFGFGACVIRKRRAGREASEKTRPTVDEEYGARMRAEALANANRDRRNEGHLPTFAEHEREHIPLNSMGRDGDVHDYDDEDDKQYHPRFASTTDVGAPSIISGVGEGYGRRDPAVPGMPVSISVAGNSLVSPGGGDGAPHSPVLAVGGVGSRLGAEARANRGRAAEGDQNRLYNGQRQGSQTTEPFQGMYDPHHQQQQQGYHDPYQQSTSPPPQQQQQQHVVSPGGYSAHSGNHLSPSYGGAYPPYPSVPTPGGASTIGSSYSQPTAVGQNAYASSSAPYGYGATSPAAPAAPAAGNTAEQKQNFSYPSSTSPPPQQQQQQYQPPAQQFYVHNQTTGDSDSIAPTYYTHDAQQGSYGGNGSYGAGGGGAPPMPNPHSPTYGSGGGQGSDMYGMPYGSSGAQRY